MNTIVGYIPPKTEDKKAEPKKPAEKKSETKK